MATADAQRLLRARGPGGASRTPTANPGDLGPAGARGGRPGAGRLAPTSALLTDVLGFRKRGEDDRDGHRTATFDVGPGGPGAEVRVVERPDLPLRAGAGIGGVHHVAFRTPDAEQHAAWRERLARAGLGVTPVIDRYYFRSIYFREPGGVL